MKSRPSRDGDRARRPPPAPDPETGVVLLAGGNPQVPKGDGDAPVEAWLAGLQGWKSDTGRRVDALVVSLVPGVGKAVRWNSPFYGLPGRGWFLSMHALTRAIRVTFFAGLALDPVPPGGTPKSGQARWVDLPDGPWDEALVASWIRQAAALPGWSP
jgi:hypothetical protein